MSDHLYKVKDHEYLRRDSKSQAILNINVKEAREYEARSKMLNSSKTAIEEINSIKEKLADLESVKKDMQEIKELLRGLIK